MAYIRQTKYETYWKTGWRRISRLDSHQAEQRREEENRSGCCNRMGTGGGCRSTSCHSPAMADIAKQFRVAPQRLSLGMRRTCRRTAEVCQVVFRILNVSVTRHIEMKAGLVSGSKATVSQEGERQVGAPILWEEVVDTSLRRVGRPRMPRGDSFNGIRSFVES